MGRIHPPPSGTAPARLVCTACAWPTAARLHGATAWGGDTAVVPANRAEATGAHDRRCTPARSAATCAEDGGDESGGSRKKSGSGRG
jgi:hypothetical protein